MTRCHRFLSVLATVVLVANVAVAEDRDALVIHLSNGTEVSGRMTPGGFDEAVGITMIRDDNGGRLSLRWDQIRDEDVEGIKRSRGFVGDELPAVLIDALEVETKGGAIFVGIDEGVEDGALVLSRLGERTPIPTKSIRRTKHVQVDALELKNPANVFEEKRGSTRPEKAIDWYNLALFAESLTLYDQAEECFNRTLEVDPSFSKKELIEGRVKNLAVKRKEAEATEMLRRIDRLTRKGLFAQAVELVAEFKEKWPRSLLMRDLQEKEADLYRRRRASLLLSIKADFFDLLWKKCEQRARDPESELGPSLTWVEEDLFGEMVTHLAGIYDTTEDEVIDLWENRGVHGSPSTFSYMGGTFILGTAARDGVGRTKKEEEEESGGKKTGKEEEVKTGNTITDKIAKELEKLKKKREESKTKKQRPDDGSLADIPPTEDEWWAAAPINERRSFLQAVFCERTKHTNIVRIDGRQCATCHGLGVHEYFASNLGAKGNNNNDNRDPGKVPCSRCKRLGFDRYITVK